MRETRVGGNVPHKQFISDAVYDLLQEQKKTNDLLGKLPDGQK